MEDPFTPGLENSLFYRFGRWVYRHRWAVIGVWLLVLALSAILAPRVGSVLKSGFGEQSTEARKGLDLLEASEIVSPTLLVIVFSSDDLLVESPGYRARVEMALSGLVGFPGLEGVDTVYGTGDDRLVSEDGHTTYVLAYFDVDLDEALDMVPEVRDRIPPVDLDVWVTGGAAIFSDINQFTGEDLRRAEIITFPLVAVALLLIFGTVASVVAPLAIGAFGLTFTLAAIYLLGLVTDMSVFSMNTATLLGVGAAIDYSLLMVSRFREELPSRSVEDSVCVTVATAGRAILFSAVTTVLGLTGLLIFELTMLRSIGIGGIVVISVSLMLALTLLPAILGVMGGRIDSLPVMPKALYNRNLFWRALASWVMSHPLLVMVPLVVFLLALGTPFLNARLGIPWAGVLPIEAESRRGWDVAVEKFGEGELAPILVAATSENGVLAPESLGAIYDYSRAAASIEGVTRVESIVDLSPDITRDGYRMLYAEPSTSGMPEVAYSLEEFGGGETTMIRVYTTFDINSEQARGVVKELRALVLGEGVSFFVTGASASLMDAVDAIVMNGMSIFASSGALVFIFQEGHFEGLRNFTSTGFLEATLPILLFMILFGLSMDYEVFLLVRIKEIYDATGDNTASVALGLERTGRVITSAALVLVLVSGSFAFGDIVIIKALGLGIAIAIFLDSTIVRALLVPALMRVLGDLNWWAPGFLKKVLPR